MKNVFASCVVILWMATPSFAQVGVSNDNSSPHESAMLDVKSTSKGALMPRMTYAQRNAILNPAEGLMVYCTNCSPDGAGCVAVFQGGLWKTVDLNCHAPNIPTAGIHLPEVTQITWNWNAMPIADGYKWNSVNDYGTAIDVGTATFKTEAGLTCQTNYTRYVWAYNNCGHSNPGTLIQQTSQIPAATPTAGIHSPSYNQIVWNWNSIAGAIGYKWNTENNLATALDMGTSLTKTETGLTCLTLYTRYVWAYDPCGISTPATLTQTTTSNPPGAPTAGSHSPLPNQITWKWNTVAGATGYKWNTTNTYATAEDMGTALLKTETGLVCNTPYTRYVWAYSPCGISVVTPLTQATSNTISSPLSGNHVPSYNQIIWNWLPVSGATGYKWNTTNNYATAQDVGQLTSETETGLTVGTTYSRYVWAYNTCSVSTPVTLTQLLVYPGLSYGGGTVFYIDETGQHGLIAAPGDQSTGAEWGCNTTYIPGTSMVIGAGQDNTTAIVNGCSTAGIAARLCNSLIFPPLSPYFDWFLPSKYELQQLYLYRYIVGGFAYENYWSSSQYTIETAWVVNFSNGAQAASNKNNTFHVRAVRAF